MRARKERVRGIASALLQIRSHVAHIFLRSLRSARRADDDSGGADYASRLYLILRANRKPGFHRSQLISFASLSNGQYFFVKIVKFKRYATSAIIKFANVSNMGLGVGHNVKRLRSRQDSNLRSQRESDF